MKSFCRILFLMMSVLGYAQVKQALDAVFRRVLDSPKFMAANISFYVTDENGNEIYNYNAQRGLSTASTQKIFTALAALDLLGKNFRYTTIASYDGVLSSGVLSGNLYLSSDGDPSLGSWRYKGYKPKDFLEQLYTALSNEGIDKIDGNIIIDDSYFDFQNVPGGWCWNDVGNYYGAGVWGVNWRENQYDIKIRGGERKGEATQVLDFSYQFEDINIVNDLVSGSKDSRDKSIIYTSPHSGTVFINGTIPAGKTSVISGATPNPPLQIGVEMKKFLSLKNIKVEGEVLTFSGLKIKHREAEVFSRSRHEFWQYHSPPLSDIVHWFLRKSVNLYGETLLKTLGKRIFNKNNTEESAARLRAYWTGKGIAPMMIAFEDGSGLSPQNYASAKAEVQALRWGKSQPWFETFYEALPTINGLKMKSGTIKGTKAYAGYSTSRSGKQYIFSIIVNNYNGGSINEELFKILNTLK
ncbi:D-alanyl-D-alanine carboxypeptidase/D-alanyl-D-alanine endopeptidase [Riemerella columbipharyngis]|uniref:D-alanyl-D-alanine carboxypeptidase / D-alanyl-D-alanine-endopeptidase (Penicillin-binding protein 4) n=1 Tax=Riemerella columbipharyngis TaxID=1071918 RepID=A0A1G6YML4_9FLAO|nr:D-alanyl-D-alanine carboxypeptidase/D-alanyl-D-alanine-endopeptidase [Riemerella columbipharyngis]SDD91628.1 D-alanyl-D-alanine carboxypeptidase / D-alanyl-D-alanine-endopeptidase (penicillin-binding protein 4) [Riemerella columbipharyngis]